MAHDEKIFDLNIVPGRASIITPDDKILVLQCCGKDVQREWSYCPMCGEEVSWPLSAEEEAERKRIHDERMARDPAYKLRYEERRRLYEIYSGDPMWPQRLLNHLESEAMKINVLKPATTSSEPV